MRKITIDSLIVGRAMPTMAATGRPTDCYFRTKRLMPAYLSLRPQHSGRIDVGPAQHLAGNRRPSHHQHKAEAQHER